MPCLAPRSPYGLFWMFYQHCHQPLVCEERSLQEHQPELERCCVVSSINRNQGSSRGEGGARLHGVIPWAGEEPWKRQQIAVRKGSWLARHLTTGPWREEWWCLEAFQDQNVCLLYQQWALAVHVSSSPDLVEALSGHLYPSPQGLLICGGAFAKGQRIS